MPYGNVKVTGNLGSKVPYGKALPTTGAALALRGAAKLGLGGNQAAAAEPADKELGKALRGAFGIPAAKQTSKGRQNQPVKAKGKATPPMHPRSGDVLEGGTVDLYNRPKVKNKDGSISTVRSMSFQNNKKQEVLIPGVERTGKGILHQKQAQEQYGRTGEHLGKFKTTAAADKYAERLHKNQEKAYITRPRKKTVK